MFLESFWNKFSFNLLPTLPIELGFKSFMILVLFMFFPAYIAYAKQSIQRKRIYIFSLIDLKMLSQEINCSHLYYSLFYRKKFLFS